MSRLASMLVALIILSGLFNRCPGADFWQVSFGDSGYTDYGEWSVKVTASPGRWEPEAEVNLAAVLTVTNDHLKALEALKIVPDGFCMLATAERTFDAGGRLRLASDERMSTLLTPTGIAIEGGVQGAVTRRFGYGFNTPLDQFQTRKLEETAARQGAREIRFAVRQKLPSSLPPGIYRLRLDFGVTMKTRNYDLNGGAFARRPFFKGRPTESHLYSPPIPADGVDPRGWRVDADGIRPRLPWVLLANYNSNGYRGVVAEEDKCCFALSGRNLIQDDVILPRYDDNGRRIAYSLEPQFPPYTIEARSNIPLDHTKGELTVEVTNPDGSVTNLGSAPFVGTTGIWPGTKDARFTQWVPPAYGRYTVKATGWTEDVWGNRYEGGGTYHFWIAKRMTLATATFQGMPYPVGNRYGRDIGFAPAVPAEVEVNATLFVNSDPSNKRQLHFTGKASPSGVFGAAQGNRALVFDAPGEYLGHVLARYWDPDGHLWVCSMRHAGVVYPPDTPIRARGKMVRINGQYFERGETHFEGYPRPGEDAVLDHINFPWNAGDVLLIASEGAGANKIEPMLLCEYRDKPLKYDPKWHGVGNTNLEIRTSNGYSPHLFPEYITDWEYFYSAGPRPGFVSRFIVGENGIRAPYWPTTATNFGGQINASSNGDLPGDIYRLIGGIVVRKAGQTPLYAGYIASAFLLPEGTNNNRVVAAGSEDVIGPTGAKGRVFLVGTRPGMLYEAGTSFAPGVQIDPILPVNVRFTLTYPDGRRVLASGAGGADGSWVGAERWTLDQPGIYRFQLEADWEGHRGVMPGLPPEGGEFYVIEKDRPADAPRLELELGQETVFSPLEGLRIAGRSTARTVYYAAVIPGAVIGQGTLEVRDGRFEYYLVPQLIHNRTPTYDILNRRTGRPDLKDVIHLTLFSQEQARDGRAWHSFVRLIVRGDRVLYTK